MQPLRQGGGLWLDRDRLERRRRLGKREDEEGCDDDAKERRRRSACMWKGVQHGDGTVSLARKDYQKSVANASADARAAEYQACCVTHHLGLAAGGVSSLLHRVVDVSATGV